MARQVDHIRIAYQLQFDSSFHCGTGLTDGLVHRSVTKDRDSYLYIPGSTIKGVLRETCERIACVCGLTVRDPHDEKAARVAFNGDPDIVEYIFGSRYQEGSLFFDNACMTNEWKDFFNSPQQQKKYLHLQAETRTQTSIWRQTGTAKEGALYTSEFGIPGLTFLGEIRGCLEGYPDEFSGLPGSYSSLLLIAGLHGIECIGANRSSGAGRCQCSVRQFEVNGQGQNPRDYLDNIVDFEYYTLAREEG